MKILAIEKELRTVDWENEIQTLIEEAKSAYKLILSGNLREIYFTENKHAVLILECEDKMVAKQLLDKLPLVKKEIIAFEIMELQPYTGFTRLMNLE
ncbi:MAG: superoxide dismutase [Bacteroidota bacterium]